jgi:cyclopropane fatty-acyl-phospholipid synthase-like methyltransferase
MNQSKFADVPSAIFYNSIVDAFEVNGNYHAAITHGGIEEMWTHLLNLARNKRAMTIIDSGGGIGSFARWLDNQGHWATAVTNSSSLFFRGANKGNPIALDDMTQYLAKEKDVDAIFNLESLGYVSLPFYFRACRNALGKGGNLVVKDFSPTPAFTSKEGNKVGRLYGGYVFRSAEEIMSEALMAGFRLKHYETHTDADLRPFVEAQKRVGHDAVVTDNQLGVTYLNLEDMLSSIPTANYLPSIYVFTKDE